MSRCRERRLLVKRPKDLPTRHATLSDRFVRVETARADHQGGVAMAWEANDDTPEVMRTVDEILAEAEANQRELRRLLAETERLMTRTRELQMELAARTAHDANR